MYFGFQSMTEFPFLTVGFFLTMVGALGFGAAFMLGLYKGGLAALKFTRIWVYLIAAALIFTVVYAMVSGQWKLFLIEFGFGPLVEMGVLAVGFIAIMWFMAYQYAMGRIDLDERFGRSKEK